MKVHGTTGEVLHTLAFRQLKKTQSVAYIAMKMGIIAVGYKGGAYDDESFIVTSAQAFMMKIDADLSTVLWKKTFLSSWSCAGWLKPKTAQAMLRWAI